MNILPQEGKVSSADSQSTTYMQHNNNFCLLYSFLTKDAEMDKIVNFLVLGLTC